MRESLEQFWISEQGSVADEYALLITMIILVGAASLHAAGIPFASLADFVSGTFEGLSGVLSGDLADRN